jgi:hypothetical protein
MTKDLSVEPVRFFEIVPGRVLTIPAYWPSRTLKSPLSELFWAGALHRQVEGLKLSRRFRSSIEAWCWSLLICALEMVARWYCCRCHMLNVSTHHNAVYCRCRHHVCGTCRHARIKNSPRQSHSNQNLHRRNAYGGTCNRSYAIHDPHDTLHQATFQIGVNVIAGVVVAAATSASCSIM